MPDATTERPPPTNVIAALARVMEELPGIGRNERSQQGYNYRGIEAITREASSLLGRYGVVFVPKVVERKTIDLTVNGKPWTEDHATIVYTVYGPGGVSDRIEVGPLIALGRDNSDKGMNKCMTQAFKYALLQVLCVGDSKDDSDAGHAVEADSHGQPAGEGPNVWFANNGWKDEADYDATRKAIADQLAAASESVKTAFRVWWANQGVDWKAAWPKPLAGAVVARLEALTNERPDPPDDPNPAPDPQTPLPDVPSDEFGDPEPLPDPDPRTTALIAFLEGLRPVEVGEALKARDATQGGTTDARRQRLAKLLLKEGWEPGRGHLPPTETPPMVCVWCSHAVTTKGNADLVDYGPDGLMHAEPCRPEWVADKDEAERPF